MKPHPSLKYVSLDTMAECFDGIPMDLRTRLWDVLTEHCRPMSEQIDIEDSCPADAIGINTVADNWHHFTTTEQRMLNTSAEAQESTS